MNKITEVMETEIYTVYKNEIRKIIEAGKIKIPVLPKIAAQVFAMTRANAHVSIADLAELISKDQLLTGHVLKIINSASFAIRREITTIKDAVAMLGIKMISEIAISVSMKGTFFKVPEYQQEINDILRHSLISGIYAKEIGKHFDLEDESLYLCGLMHTVGKPVMLQMISEIQKRNKIELPKGESLTYILDNMHQEVGAKIAEEWELSDLPIITGKYYNNYNEVENYKNETVVVYLADLLADSIVHSDETSEDAVRQDIAINVLGDKADMEKLLSKSKDIDELAQSMSK